MWLLIFRGEGTLVCWFYTIFAEKAHEVKASY